MDVQAALFVQRNGTVRGYANAGVDFDSGYEFVYLDDRLYRPKTVESGGRAYLALEPVNDSDPLRAVAATDLTTREWEVVESGRITSYRRILRDHLLLRVDGDYYFVSQTGHKGYGGSGADCVSSGRDFCEEPTGSDAPLLHWRSRRVSSASRWWFQEWGESVDGCSFDESGRFSTVLVSKSEVLVSRYQP